MLRSHDIVSLSELKITLHVYLLGCASYMNIIKISPYSNVKVDMKKIPQSVIIVDTSTLDQLQLHFRCLPDVFGCYYILPCGSPNFSHISIQNKSLTNEGDTYSLVTTIRTCSLQVGLPGCDEYSYLHILELMKIPFF